MSQAKLSTILEDAIYGAQDEMCTLDYEDEQRLLELQRILHEYGVETTEDLEERLWRLEDLNK